MFIANWKMNGSEAMLKKWLAEIKENLNHDARSSCILCPPVCFISQASKIIQRDDLGLGLGAQDVDPETNSALTGGISGSMLKDLGSEYVIVGHSERRVNLNESSSLLKSKLEAATISGLKVIYCIGESLEEKKEGKSFEVLENQLKVFNSLTNLESVIAYEPVWAIGTGKVAQISYISEMHNFIIEKTKELNINLISLAYGGSVNSSSSKEILSLEEVNGLLIGGASLEAKEFSKIVNSIEN